MRTPSHSSLILPDSPRFAGCTHKSTSGHDPVETSRCRQRYGSIKTRSTTSSSRRPTIADFPDAQPDGQDQRDRGPHHRRSRARERAARKSIYFASGEYVTPGAAAHDAFQPGFRGGQGGVPAGRKQSQKVGRRAHADPSDFANLAQLARKKLETMGLRAEDIDGLRGKHRREGRPPDRSARPRSGVIIDQGRGRSAISSTWATRFSSSAI